MTDAGQSRLSRLRHLPRRRREPSVAAAVARFVVTGAAAVGLLTFLGTQLLRHIGNSEAVRDSKQLTRLASRGVEPFITPQLLAGDPRAVAQLDRVIRRRVLFDPVVRVKIWDASSRIIYSDERALIGSRYPLGEEELAALRNGGSNAEISDLSRPENRFERGYKKLLEVYLGLRATNGTPILFEAYQRFSSVASSGQRLW